MRSMYKAGMKLSVLFGLALGIAHPSRACEPTSDAFGAFCVCEPSGFELSGSCYDIGGDEVPPSAWSRSPVMPAVKV